MPESVGRLWELVSLSAGHLSTGELIVRIALICCSLFASVQLLSMWGTNYGDHNATSKSFFLSLLLHCCFGLGWATVVDRMPQIAGGSIEPKTRETRVTLTRDANDTTDSANASRSSLNSSTQPLEIELTRIQRAEQEPSDEQVLQTEKAPTVERQLPETPDLPARIDVPTPTPQQAVPSVAAISAARPTTDIDSPDPQARPETPTVTTAMRQPLSRESSAVDLSSRIEPQRGAAERTSPLIEDGAVLTLPSELVSESTPKPVGVTDDLIRRRSNPIPAPADLVEPGSSPAATAALTTGNRQRDKFTRSGGPNGPDTDFEPVQTSRSTPTNSSLPGREQLIASRASMGNEIPGQSPRPQVSRPQSSPLSTSRTPTRDPETYRSRRLEQRRAIALKNGGSEQSEKAVEASLKWMASIQEPAGYWSASRHGGGAVKKDPQGHDRKDGGLHADSGITGLVVLSYLGAGYTHEEGKYSDVIQRAIKWLIAQQQQNGYLGGGRASEYDQMYCHAMATFALAEAYGMQNDPNAFPELRETVRGGVRLICDMQNNDGGWRYGKGKSDSDMSMFGWQLMALKSAVNAGIPVPDETRRGMTKFLKSRELGTNGGLAGYKATENPTPAMTAEALFCRQMFGVHPSNDSSQEAVMYLRRNLPRLGAYDEYYWYYGTLAMFQYDGQPWEEWNGALRDMLVGQQRRQGPLAGSWDPVGKWAGIGGRLYSTAVSTMCLEVYYRFLRIYQTSDE